MADEARTIHKLARKFDHKSGVVNEFASETAAKSEWKRLLTQAGYKPRSNGEWYKPGHPVIVEPH